MSAYYNEGAAKTTFISTRHARRRLRVLLGGCTGYMGRVLWEYFTYKGFDVIPVARQRAGVLDPSSVIDFHMLQEFGLPRCDFVVNASGVNIFSGAWSDGYKEELEKSRLMPTKLLAKLIRESDEKPMAFATIGTIYYYPPSKEPLDERYVHKPEDLVTRSYFSRLEEAVERSARVYIPDQDIKPKQHKYSVNPTELYNEEVTRSADGVIVPSGPDAVPASPFSTIKVREGQAVVSLARDIRQLPDAKHNFLLSASTLNINSNPRTNEEVRLLHFRVAQILGNRAPIINDFAKPGATVAPFGTGHQITPWIHEADVGPIIVQALANEEVSGPVNCVAPNLPTNEDFMTTLGIAAKASFSAFNRRGLAAKYGPVQAQLLLDDYNVVPRRALQELGYQFQFPDIKSAAKDIFSRPVAPLQKYN